METVKTLSNNTEVYKSSFFTGFAVQYLSVFLIFFATTSFLVAKNKTVENILWIAKENPVMIAIIIVFIIGIIRLFSIFIDTAKEDQVLRKLEGNRDILCAREKRIPLKETNESSILLDRFRFEITARKFDWSERSITNLEKYLEEVFFSDLKWINFLVNMLPLGGILGTAWGIFNACKQSGEISSEIIMGGVTNGVGAVVLAMYSIIVIAVLNHLLIRKRKRIFRAMLVIFS